MAQYLQKRFSHDYYMFRQQYKIVVLKYCCSFIQNSSKHFCIYCHLTFACFCITPFRTCSSTCIKLYILCSCLYFCLCLLTIHICFASLQYSALQYSFGTMISFLVPFMYTFFVQAFLSATILNLYFSHFEICITQNVS